MRKYVELLPRGEGLSTYIKKEVIGELNEISAVIFDCDGVLIDVSEAYAQTVKETVYHLTKALTGIQLYECLIDGETIHEFKRTGGFNNDWDLTYAIISFLFSRLSQKELNHLENIAKDSLKIVDPAERFKCFINKAGRFDQASFKKLKRRMIEFAGRLNESGVKSIEGKLKRPMGVNLNLALGSPGIVKVDIIPTLFEQLHCGSYLFEKTYGECTIFKGVEHGSIEGCQPIIKSKTLKSLTKRFGKNRLGIASGSMETPARHILGRLMEAINPNAQVWMDNVQRAEEESGGSLSKPDPFSLRTASQPLEPFKKALYVGDTLADQIMTKRANKEEQRYLFTGVYLHTPCPSKNAKDFLDKGADIVTPSVNELPEIFEYLRS